MALSGTCPAWIWRVSKPHCEGSVIGGLPASRVRRRACARRHGMTVRLRGIPEWRVPRLRAAGAARQVLTRGTPPRLEGCRPASRGLSLALMTCPEDRRQQPRDGKAVSHAGRGRRICVLREGFGDIETALLGQMGGRPSAAPPHSFVGTPTGACRRGRARIASGPPASPSLLCRATAPRRDRRALRSLDLVSSLPVDGQMARKPQIRRLDPGLLRHVSAVRVEMGRVLASHVRATVVALGVVSALALTGCSDGAGAQPGPSKSGPPSSTTTASPAPSSTASTTASPSGTATVAVPAAARAHTEEGAKAFAELLPPTKPQVGHRIVGSRGASKGPDL